MQQSRGGRVHKMILIFILLSILLPSLWGQSYTIPPGGGSSTANIPGYICLPSGASTTTYTCSPTPAATAYDDGMIISFMPDVTNTGSSTVNVNGLGAKTIQKLVSGTLTNVAAGDLDSDVPYLLTYNGTVFVVSSGDVQWGDITGTLSNQTDLQSALDAKVATADLASQAEAEAGTNNTKWMSPLRTAQAISALDFSGLIVTKTDTDELTISAGLAMIGSASAITASAQTVTNTGGNGNVYIYVSSAGVLSAGRSAGVTGITCSAGCTDVGVISDFPTDSVPLALWTVASGVYNSSGTLLRTANRRERVITSSNCVVTESSDEVDLDCPGTGGTDVVEPGDFYMGAGVSWQNTGLNLYSANCVDGGSTAASGDNPKSIIGYNGGGGNCYITLNNSLPVRPNGSSPIRTLLTMRGAGRATSDGNTDLYWGLSGAPDTVVNGIFIRYNDASNIWQCVARSGGSDSGTAQTITGTPDLNPHKFEIEKTTTTNEFRCRIDGSAWATVSDATIPALSDPRLIAINNGGASNTSRFQIGEFIIWVDR